MQGSINYQRAQNKKIEEARSRAVTFSAQLETGQSKSQIQSQSHADTQSHSVNGAAAAPPSSIRGILSSSVPMYNPNMKEDMDDRSTGNQSEYTQSTGTTNDTGSYNINSSSAGTSSHNKANMLQQASWISDQVSDVFDLTEAIALGGWRIIGHQVVDCKVLVLDYHHPYILFSVPYHYHNYHANSLFL